MFTGIIQGLGTVLGQRPAGGGLVFTFSSDFDLNEPQEGESIAVDGVCLTAHQISLRRFSADVSPESLRRTGLGRLKPGSTVNLERALRLVDRLGGHLVSGHVDGLARVESRRNEGAFILFSFSHEAAQSRYLIEKGSIAINGISLTVNACSPGRFSVSIIPHTLAQTTLVALQEGDQVNIEFDLIGKYVEKMLQPRGPHEEASRINAAFLARHGFV